ncbi:MAG: DMT family transporter [Alphaproteobacteria bacterium]
MGYMLAFAAVFMYALMQVINKKMVMANIPPFTIIAITMAVLFVCAALASIWVDKDFNYKSISQDMWVWLVGFGLLNFVAFSTVLYVLKTISPVEYQLLSICLPVFGAFIAYYLLSEPFYMRHFIGLVFIAIGLTIALKPINL